MTNRYKNILIQTQQKTTPDAAKKTSIYSYLGAWSEFSLDSGRSSQGTSGRELTFAWPLLT